MFQAQNRETINSTWKVADSFKIIMTDERDKPLKLPKSGHVTITKIENLHIVTRMKIHWFQKCFSFRSTTKTTVKKPFRNSGVTRRL